MNVSVRAYQLRLKKHGFDPGPIDGIRGRRTIRAIKLFQRAKRLKQDGIVGPRTHAHLFGETAVCRKELRQVDRSMLVDYAPWMMEAQKMLGVHERRDNRRLFRWLRSDGSAVGDPAKIPWCGDFVQTAIALSMPDEPLPSNPYWARNWQHFGTSCPKVYGAIASFTRGKGGHVGFVIGYDPDRDRIQILGGNQSNSVTKAWLSTRRLIATRWPATAMPHDGRVARASGAGAKLSTNEA